MKQRIGRQAQRYTAKMVVTKINGQPVSDAFLLDISAMGAKLESPAPMPLRNPIELVVLLPWAQTEANLAGVVTWIQPSGASPRRYLMGIEFYQRFWDIDQLGRAGKI
jgi:Tfp pilus assembly protein PilZ